MCGLFGFSGERPDLDALERIALLAGTRGPWACGVAWQGADGLRTTRRDGPMRAHLDILNAVSTSSASIGQTRLATSGAADHQPLARDGWAVAHNGNVYNAAAIYTALGYTPRTTNDSEALLALVLAEGGEAGPRVADAVQAVALRSPLAALFLSGGAVYGVRRGHPLFVSRLGESVYLCSRATDGAKLLPDLAVSVYRGGELMEVIPLV